MVRHRASSLDIMAEMTEEHREADEPFVVLFVCTGNICRSPMAEVVLATRCHAWPAATRASHTRTIVVESAGTSRWHEGEAMDPRARRALDDAGFGTDGSPAAQVTSAQLARAGLVVALDREHRRELLELDAGLDVTVLRWWSEGTDLDVPDPYYGDDEAFAACLALIVPACDAIAAALTAP
jgi:protein-tyrosine phosphatase